MEGLRLERSVAPVTRAQAPATGPELVSRPRLLALLESGAGRRLTLLSAPAGFGKTTLLAEWASTADGPVAWLSLDERDGDPAVFLADVAEALAAHGRPAALVLDDHERIAGTPGEESLWRCVAEAPSTLRIVLCGRVRPELPDAVAGDVLEIRPGDLRMTDAEAAELLYHATGGSFAVREVMRQIELCEGRPAALRLVVDGGAVPEQARAERNALPRPDRLRPNPVLTEPELAVLRLLSDGLSKREIGAELTLSFNTVHSHTKAIYSKLGVSSRHEAAARAHELGVG
jgi:ATP/maltotriose-dependent transcriptional regulator MalT